MGKVLSPPADLIGVGPLPARRVNAIELHPDIMKAAQRIRVLWKYQGVEKELPMIPVWNYNHFDPPINAMLFIFGLPESGGAYNPEMVMDIWEEVSPSGEGVWQKTLSGKWCYWLMRDGGAELEVYLDGVLIGTFSGDVQTSSFMWYVG